VKVGAPVPVTVLRSASGGCLLMYRTADAEGEGEKISTPNPQGLIAAKLVLSSLHPDASATTGQLAPSV